MGFCIVTFSAGRYLPLAITVDLRSFLWTLSYRMKVGCQWVVYFLSVLFDTSSYIYVCIRPVTGIQFFQRDRQHRRIDQCDLLIHCEHYVNRDMSYTRLWVQVCWVIQSEVRRPNNKAVCIYCHWHNCFAVDWSCTRAYWATERSVMLEEANM